MSKLDDRIEYIKNKKPLGIVGVRFVWNKDKTKVIMEKIK